jgi:hypothetical protein
MQLKLFVLAAFLPAGLMAMPSAEAAEAEIDSRAAIKRPQYCTIVGNSATVKCREGPGTKYDVRRTLRKGDSYDFWCVLSKECVTISGSTNWYVCGSAYARVVTDSLQWLALHPSAEMFRQRALHFEWMH